MTNIYGLYIIPVQLPWIFLGGPLTFNGAPANILDDLERNVYAQHSQNKTNS